MTRGFRLSFVAWRAGFGALVVVAYAAWRIGRGRAFVPPWRLTARQQSALAIAALIQALGGLAILGSPPPPALQPERAGRAARGAASPTDRARGGAIMMVASPSRRERT